MRNWPFSVLPHFVVLNAALLCSSPILAQTAITINPPDFRTVDAAYVNLNSGFPSISVATVQIGSTDHGFHHSFVSSNGEAELLSKLNDPLQSQVELILRRDCEGRPPPLYTGCHYLKVFGGGGGEIFLKNDDGTWRAKGFSGSSIIKSSDGYVLTKSDGTILKYLHSYADYNRGTNARIASVTRPNGIRDTYHYAEIAGKVPQEFRLVAVVRNTGYQLRYTYVNSTSWNVASITAINTTQDYCPEGTAGCTLTRAWPTASFAGMLSAPAEFGAPQTLTVTNWRGEITTFTNTMIQAPLVTPGERRLTALKETTGSGENTVTYEHDSIIHCSARSGIWDCSNRRSAIVSRASRGAGSWSYKYEQNRQGNNPDPEAIENNLLYATSTPPAGPNSHTYFSGSFLGFPIEASVGRDFVKYGNGVVTDYQAANGPRYSYVTDSRGNYTERRQLATAGSGLSDLVSTAGYDAVCTNPVKCNKPNWIKDANGNQTDFSYDPVHGGILKETLPADDKGIRPQKRYTYVQRHAWLKNASGTYVKASSPIWLLNSVSFCRTGNAAASGTGCALGAADEVVTTYGYGPDSGPNNLLPRSQTVTSTDAGVTTTLRTCYSYDALGNKISETSPGAQLASCS